MAKKHSKEYGTLIDRTLRIIKLNFIQGFKEVGVDLTPEQWVMIDRLHQQNGISQTELANGSFKNAPTVSRIIDLLCQKGLTERNRFDNDRRRYKIFLTEKGIETFNKANPVAQKLREQGWSNLSESDYENFTRIMNQVFDNFSE
ncbi:MAG: DNA-binding MarR family transcriptional regulator [Saprospiraceae bacterium]|jgi:DNA-binding MarR family transcriptional regulator